MGHALKRTQPTAEARHAALVLALLKGRGVEEAAEEVGYTPGRVYQLLKDAPFRAELDARRTAMLEQAGSGILDRLKPVVQELLRLSAGARRESDRIAAAKVLLDKVLAIREHLGQAAPTGSLQVSAPGLTIDLSGLSREALGDILSHAAQVGTAVRVIDSPKDTTLPDVVALPAQAHGAAQEGPGTAREAGEVSGAQGPAADATQANVARPEPIPVPPSLLSGGETLGEAGERPAGGPPRGVVGPAGPPGGGKIPRPH